MTNWRWDQGRIIYFQFDVLKEIARVLIKYDGKNVNDNEIAASFKNSLINSSGLPFLPINYKVNRNYSRVFQCALLATTKDKGTLVCTDICKMLAEDNSSFESADDYLMEVVNRFRFPFPAFQEYNDVSPRIFPFIAIIKYLIAKKRLGEDTSLSLDEIADYIIGNECTGLEDIDFYCQLKHTGYTLVGDSIRQLREMIVFMGQLSFLKIYNKRIYLDILSEEDANLLLNELIRPCQTTPLQDKVEEFLSITSIKNDMIVPQTVKTSDTIIFSNPTDLEFAEGKRKRVHHLRIERSPLLRKIYIQLHPEPICDACKQNMKFKYPWTSYMLDLHHLLPLSSVIRTLETGTTLNDMVGLCPSCHHAIHSYYNKWLKSNNQEDFKSKVEAMDVYLNAIKEIA